VTLSHEQHKITEERARAEGFGDRVQFWLQDYRDIDGPGSTNPWIANYIFPSGYSPALSEVLAIVEQSGLYVTDVEVWRLHYAETLKNGWVEPPFVDFLARKALYLRNFGEQGFF